MKYKQAWIGPGLLLLVWAVFSGFRVVNRLFLPSPLAVAQSLVQLFAHSLFYLDLVSTLSRLAIGFTIGAFAGVALGIPAGYSDRLYRSLEFLIDFFRSVPVTALFPLFLLFFGLGDAAKVGIAAWSSSLVVLFNTIYGVRNARELRALVAITMRATKFQVLYRVILPDALPQVFVGLRTALSLGLVVVVVTEMFLGTVHGLGQRIYNSSMTYRVPEMYGTILVTGMVGYLLNLLSSHIESRVVHWGGKA